MDEKDSGLGCLVSILAFSIVAGNIFLFSGDLASGGDLEGNQFAIFMTLIAVIADIILVGYIISVFSKRSEKQREEKERQRINAVTQKVNELLNRYSPLKTTSLQTARQLDVENSFINKEVVFKVNQFKDSLIDKISKCNAVNQAINRILFCSGCQSIDEKFEYLSAKAEELQRLKNESDLLYRDTLEHKIKLLNENEDLLLMVKKSLTDLHSSKKCITEGFNLKEFICEEKPFDLGLFDYKYAPATLHIGAFYYCLFSNVILVFDAMGIFSSAIDPTALSVNTERVRVDVLVSDNTLPSHQYIDVDSKCVEQGITRHTWVHTCQDGSPDLRYSNNPSIEYRTDIYEYGKVTISILDNEVSLYLSSDIAIESLERISRGYIRKCNNRHNPIPEFLNLLNKVSEDGEKNIVYIMDKNSGISFDEDYFCTII